MKRRICGTVAVAACLAVPAGAVAHPSVYTVTAKVAPAGVTNPTEAQLTDQLRYFMNNDGWAYALRETNGKTTNGTVNYALLPGAFRSSLTKEQWLAPKYVTGLQPHATCDVASLTSKATILSWQNDPFWDYVPFQKTSAGLGDDPAKWIPVVKTATGVDLSTVTDFAAACAGIGGTYVKADEVQTSAASLVGEYVASIVDPIEAKVVELEAVVAKASTDAATDDAEIARLTAENRVLSLTAPASIRRRAFFKGGVLLALNGPPARKVRVTLKNRRFGLIGSATGTTGADYDLGVTLKPSKKAAKALKKAKSKTIRLTLEATTGDRFARKTIKLVK